MTTANDGTMGVYCGDAVHRITETYTQTVLAEAVLEYCRTAQTSNPSLGHNTILNNPHCHGVLANYHSKSLLVITTVNLYSLVCSIHTERRGKTYKG